MAVVHITSPVAPVKAKSAGCLVVSLSESDIWDYGATAVEVGNLGYRNISISELRTFYPNAKIVTLASDTLYYIKNNRFQIDHPAEVDLWKVKITDSAGNTVWSGTQGFTKGESSLSLRYPEVTGVYQINVQCISITGGVRAEVNQSLTVEP